MTVSCHDACARTARPKEFGKVQMPRLIESDFPFPQLSLIAERESWRKEIYRPVYYLHKWWARRLGSVFRGILLGACLDESENFWEHYYSSNGFGDQVVFDPFMGSGVTVGEAIKLGCRAVGRDINQVAYLSCCAALSKYSPVQVLSTFKQLERALAPKLLSYFTTRTEDGDDATVLYYFLVKVVACPKCNLEIDLFPTRIFSRNAVPRKDPSARSICPVCEAVNLTTFDADTVHCPECGFTYNPRQSNIRGAEVTCNHCQHAFRLVDRMRQLEGPLGFRRYAKLVLTRDGAKLYESLNETDRELERRVAAEFVEIVDSFPQVAVAPGYNTNQVLKHNYRYWHQMFSDRQLVCIRHMVDAIKGIEHEDLRLLFACLFSGVLEFNNLFASFKGEGTGAVRHMFAHHVLKPEMTPLEANLWGTSKSSGAFSCLFNSRVKRALAYKSDPFELRINGAKSTKVHSINEPLATCITDNFSLFESDPDTVYLSNGDSSCTDLPDESVDLIVTDPPFFDNVHYSQLADFFYYWLNQILDVSPHSTTRSPNEVQDTDSDLFTAKLTGVFAECRRVLRPRGLFIFTYHHSRHEGWIAVHRAIRHAGFACVQSYPIKAEMSVSMPLQQAKSPIHLDLILVCRKDSQGKSPQNGNPNIATAVSAAKEQVSFLKGTGIQVSLGDAKVILMGRLLCEFHSIRNLDLEEKFLDEIEEDIDSFVSQVAVTQGEVLYHRAALEPVQLTLFEEMGHYLANKRTRSKRY
jgi:putative DNA methylase